MKPRVLVVDDDAPMRRMVVSCLARTATCWEAVDAEDGLRMLLQEVPDLAIVDFVMPAGGGERFVREARRHLPGCAILGVSGQATPSDFVELMRLGMADFLPKPFTPDDLVRAIPRALRARAVREEMAFPQGMDETDGPPDPFRALRGRSPTWSKAVQSLRSAASSRAGILLVGPTGVGKQLAARCVHAASDRNDRPFVVVACGALAPSLMQVELFGHVAGAFSGAPGARPGAIEAARGGTVLLSEIGSIPREAQGGLLRLLDDGAVQRLGEPIERSVDVRVIATSSEDIDALVARGQLREDLRQRIDRVRVDLPPLSERGDDVLLIATVLLRRIAASAQRRTPALSGAAARTLRGHDWPGNVRELGNTLEQACIEAGWADLIEERHLAALLSRREFRRADPAQWPLPESGLSLPALLREVEEDLVAQALERSLGDQGKAAALLRIARSSLQRKLARAGRGKA